MTQVLNVNCRYEIVVYLVIAVVLDGIDTNNNVADYFV